MKKIFFIISTLRRGGAERVALLIYRYLKQKKYKTKFILFSHQTDYKDTIESISINLPATDSLFRKIRNFLLRIIKLCKIIKKENPNYIITFMESANFVSIPLFPSKTIVTVHTILSVRLQYFNLIVKLFYKFMIQIFYNKAYKVIAVSNSVRDDLIENFGLNASKIEVIYNPIDNREILLKSKESVKELYLKSQKYFINIARLVDAKDQLSLLKVYAQLSAQIRDKYHLVIIGDGPKYKELIETIKEWNLGEYIHILGKRENPYKYLKKAKLFLLTSKIEGFGIAIVESLFLQIPVVAFDTPASIQKILSINQKDEIKKNIYLCDYGVLVSNRDISSMAQAVEFLIKNKKIYNLLKRKSKQRAKDFYIDMIGNKFLKLFK